VGADALKAFLKKILIYFLFSLRDLLKSSVKLVIDLKETGGDGLFGFSASAVESGKFSRLSFFLNLVISSEQIFALFHGKIEVKLAVTTH